MKKKKRRNYTIKKWSGTEDNELLRLFDEGLIYREIGAKLGRSAKSVFYRLQRLGRSRLTEENWTQEEKQQLLALKLSGKKPAEIAEKIGRNANTVKIMLCRLRKEI